MEAGQRARLFRQIGPGAGHKARNKRITPRFSASFKMSMTTFFKSKRALWLIALIGLTLNACGSIDRSVASGNSADTSYRIGKASRDGIGKFYMGREISHVMGHPGASWLERPDREREERTDLLIANLPLNKDSVVADIGAGTGYFSFRIAERIPNGRVLTVDIQQEMLDIIEARQARGAPVNVQTVLGTEDDTLLPESSVDLILIVDAYHKFEFPYEMGVSMARALRPGGQLVLIEYREEDPSVPIKKLHKMSQLQAKREMENAGLVRSAHRSIRCGLVHSPAQPLCC